MATALPPTAPGTRLPAPGVYANTPAALYHAWDAASNSRLSKLQRSPAHLRAYLDEPPEDTDALRQGRAVHAAILEPDAFTTEFVAAPQGLDRRTTAGKQAYGEFLAQSIGKTVLSADEHAMCLAIRDSVHRRRCAIGVLEGAGEVELSVLWTHGETGLACKARWDRYTPGLGGGTIVDVKTTRNASLNDFERSLFTYGYHRQAAFYLDSAAAHGMAAEHYVIIAVEKEAPYEVAVYRLTEGAIDAGREQLQPLIRRYAECVRSNTWPGYPDVVQDIALPSWAWDKINVETGGEA